MKGRILSIILILAVTGSFAMLEPASSKNIDPQTRDPIDSLRIFGDEDLGDAAELHGTGGSGTKNDPYIFQNLVLDDPQYGSGLVIKNTEKHAIFNRCVFKNGSVVSGFPESGCGAYLLGAANIHFVDCRILDNELYGIRCIESREVLITYTEIERTSVGVDLANSNRIKMTQNSIRECGSGIHIQDTPNCTISDNSMIECINNGISLLRSNNNVITYNLLLRNGNYGISLKDCSGNQLYYNSFCYNKKTNETYFHSRPQAKDDSISNSWSNEEDKGNHWRDLMGPDLDFDGKVDKSYWLDGVYSKDLHPRVRSKIDTVPSNPRAVCVKMEEEGAVINWTEPWDDGKCDITSYSLYRSVDGEPMTIIDSFEGYIVTRTDHDVEEKRTYSYSIKAHNSMGSSIGSDPITSYRDIKPPTVMDLYPRNGTSIKSRELTIHWYCSDDQNISLSYRLKVDGYQLYSGKAESYFIRSLQDGEHTIELTAIDSGGNSDTAHSTFYIDTLGPNILIENPLDRSFFNTSHIQLKFNISDKVSDIAKLEIMIDEGSWEMLQPYMDKYLLDLMDGEHLLKLRATDGAGNIVTEMVNFTVDTMAPWIVNVSHPNGTRVNSNTFLFQFEIDEPTSGTWYTVMKLDNRDWLELDRPDRIELKHLSNGEHRIFFKVFDNARNFVLKEYHFMVDIEAPWISEKGPMGNDILSGTPVWFTFNEQIDISTLQVAIEGFIIHNISEENGVYSFIPPFIYVPGYKVTVKIMVKDLVGNTMPEYGWSFYSGDPVYVLNGTVKGRIIGSNGIGIPDAFVFFTTLEYTRTNDTGWFEHDIRFGNYTCRVKKDGFMEMNFNVSIRGGEELLVDNKILYERKGEAPKEEKGLPALVLIISGSILILLIIVVTVLVLRKRKDPGENEMERERKRLYSSVEIPADLAEAFLNGPTPEDEEAILSIFPTLDEDLNGENAPPDDLDMIGIDIETFSDTRRVDLSVFDDELEEMDWTELANPLYDIEIEDLPKMEDIDCYRKLGVGSDATREEIRKAYRRLAALYHPDRISRFDHVLQIRAIEEMKRINYAKETLLGNISEADKGRNLLNSAKIPLNIKRQI